MNIIQKIKALFAVKSTVEEIITEVKMPTASGKPGWKTTEFWGKIGTQVLTLWGAVSGLVDPKWAAVITVGLEAVYTICRTTAKAVSDIQTTRAGQPVAETASASVTIGK